MDHQDLNAPLLAFDEYLGTGSGIGKHYYIYANEVFTLYKN